jgi:hypothetical protein
MRYTADADPSNRFSRLTNPLPFRVAHFFEEFAYPHNLVLRDLSTPEGDEPGLARRARCWPMGIIFIVFFFVAAIFVIPTGVQDETLRHDLPNGEPRQRVVIDLRVVLETVVAPRGDAEHRVGAKEEATGRVRDENPRILVGVEVGDLEEGELARDHREGLRPQNDALWILVAAPAGATN